MHEHSTRKHTPKSLIRNTELSMHAVQARKPPSAGGHQSFLMDETWLQGRSVRKRVCVSAYVSVCVCVCVLVWGVCVCNPTMRTESLRCCMQSLHPAVDYSFHVGQKTNLICATYAVTLCLRDRVKLCCISQTYFYLCFQVN